MNFRVILFSKLAFLYYLITGIRNTLYDKGWKKSRSFSVKTICIGNLSMGGTGKSPMTEYIIDFFKANYKVVTLSRGYGRKTKGYAEVKLDSLSNEVGDEPLQFKRKFPEINVAVCEDRCEGIDKIMGRYPDTGIILLDDAFQHRKLKAGLNILLTDYRKLFIQDYIFPSGTLRESRHGAKRADVIVVTKCPENLGEGREKIIQKIKRKADCPVVFSRIKYADLRKLGEENNHEIIHKDFEVLLFTGIANPLPLVEKMQNKFKRIHKIHYSDHHEYSLNDLVQIQETFNKFAAEKKIIITTEKDAMRLRKPELEEILKTLPIYTVPIEVDFFPEDKLMFNNILMDYAKHD